jgi:hypothetical protein
MMSAARSSATMSAVRQKKTEVCDMTYAPIAEHGLIGDLQSAALVATDGTVDWFCCPRFDSPSVFASVLDDRKGGRFALTPLSAGTVTKQMYLPDTAILVTRYLSEHGVAEVLDFMPIQDPQTATDRRRLVRAVIGIRGEIELEAQIEPRFDYGRRPHTTHLDGRRAHFECEGQALHLASTWPLERHGDDVHARFGPVTAAASCCRGARRTTTSCAAMAWCSGCMTRQRRSGVGGSSTAATAGAGGRRSSGRPSPSSS